MHVRQQEEREGRKKKVILTLTLSPKPFGQQAALEDQPYCTV